MQGPVIRQGGAPTSDGDVTAYLPDELRGKSWFNPAQSVIFVNGMLNNPDDHEKAGNGLALMLGCRVVAVFNATQGFTIDFVQCITDKMAFTRHQFNPKTSGAAYGVGSQLGAPGVAVAGAYAGGSNYPAMKRYADEAYDKIKANNPGLGKDEFVLSLIDGNPATRSLYKLLIGTPGAMLGRPIYAHSQGNLVTSNALTAVGLARGYGALNNLEVNSYGSPARNWPPGLRRTNNAFTLDPITALDLTVDWSSSKVGFKGAHAFEEYRRHDAEFVVNRFRTGGVGMTFNMDEDGLANFCVGLGKNTERLRNIFTRLEAVHFTDSDDVALLYVNKKTDAELAELNKIDRNFIDQLIRLLDAGWSSGAEKAAIDRLKRAQA